jgi:hypothetical protein
MQLPIEFTAVRDPLVVVHIDALTPVGTVQAVAAAATDVQPFVPVELFGWVDAQARTSGEVNLSLQTRESRTAGAQELANQVITLPASTGAQTGGEQLVRRTWAIYVPPAALSGAGSDLVLVVVFRVQGAAGLRQVVRLQDLGSVVLAVPSERGDQPNPPATKPESTPPDAGTGDAPLPSPGGGTAGTGDGEVPTAMQDLRRRFAEEDAASARDDARVGAAGRTRGRRDRRPSWVSRLQNDVGRIDADVRAMTASDASGNGSMKPDEMGERLRAISGDLDAARDVVSRYAALPLWRRLSGATSTYEEAQAHVQRASENLFLVQDHATVGARLPALRAAVRTLPPDDPRREAYLVRIDAALAAIGAERLVPQQRRDEPGAASIAQVERG